LPTSAPIIGELADVAIRLVLLAVAGAIPHQCGTAVMPARTGRGTGH